MFLFFFAITVSFYLHFFSIFLIFEKASEARAASYAVETLWLIIYFLSIFPVLF